MFRFLALLAIVLSQPVSAQTVAGEARVVDGDTLVMGGETIRLFGIDAPELDQSCSLDGNAWACGDQAADQLRSITTGLVVSCEGIKRDQYSRLVASCAAGGYDLGATMVEYGWAVAYRRYSTAYVAHELRAKAARAGLWRSDFVMPYAHRARQTRTSATEPQRSGCVIKGNRSRRGEWIYHVPGQQYYSQTRAEEIFCSEAEARAAGYRRSKR